MKFALFDVSDETFYCGNGVWKSPELREESSDVYCWAFVESQLKLYDSLQDIQRIFTRVTKHRDIISPTYHGYSWTWNKSKKKPYDPMRFEIIPVEFKQATCIRFGR